MKNYDIVISGGRIIDPDSGMDSVGNVAISDGKIAEISLSELSAEETINAEGNVVCPGFIDLHCHPQDTEIFEVQAKDGVTTTLELEVGTGDISEFYSRWKGNAAVNYGASIGHIPVRMKVMDDPGTFLPSGDAGRREATDREIQEMKTLIRKGLDLGALAVGFGLDYTRGASRWEVIEMFKVAAEYGASCHVHLRGKGHKEPSNSIEALEEVLAVAAVTGAPLHVVHLNSTGMRAVPQLLEMISGARERGLDVTTECYPYTAGMTKIESALFDEGWQDHYGIDYEQLMRPDTGEYLNSNSFAKYREEGGWVIAFSTPEVSMSAAVQSPLTMIATDSIIENGKGHPRTAGSYTKVLGDYVRNKGELELSEAISKMTIMPARRLENRSPSFLKKGRVKVGADADLAVFNPDTVIDQSTYTDPTKPPIGMNHVIVNGIPVVANGQLEPGAYPGKGILGNLKGE
ncbi:MAG: amidohydrolase family protein [SAR202 cluster bacterium]|nr:amidohydrolase family protein [SAR202 cluster bacterium]MQG75528.1 amidohydrolase family protein [SAR202 cluster bacterium]